jgi:hypothetical protein
MNMQTNSEDDSHLYKICDMLYAQAIWSDQQMNTLKIKYERLNNQKENRP